MSNHENSFDIVPFINFSNRDLANSLYNLIQNNKQQLQERSFVKDIVRYGSSSREAERVIFCDKDELLQGKVGHYAIVSSSDNIIGLARINPSTPLIQARYPLPGAFSLINKDKLSMKDNPNINFWLDKDTKKSLYSRALKKLVELSFRFMAPQEQHHIQPWLIEPYESSPEIHESFIHAGFTMKDVGLLFDNRQKVTSNKVNILYMFNNKD